MKAASKIYKKVLLFAMGALATIAGINSCGKDDHPVRPLYGVDQDTNRVDSIVPYYGVRSVIIEAEKELIFKRPETDAKADFGKEQNT